MTINYKKSPCSEHETLNKKLKNHKHKTLNYSVQHGMMGCQDSSTLSFAYITNLMMRRAKFWQEELWRCRESDLLKKRLHTGL